MRSKASASPCCARWMACASLRSRASGGPARAAGPVGRDQVLSMPSLPPKVVYLHYLLLSNTAERSWLPGVFWGGADCSGAPFAAALRQAGSILASSCAARRFLFNDGLGVSDATLCRNAGISSMGSTQRKDFNTLVVSRTLVFRS